MNRYPQEEISARKLLRRAVRLHYLTLKHIILFLLCMTVVKYIAVFLMGLYPDLFLEILIEVLAAVLMIYFFAAALLSTHYAFIDNPFQSAFASIKAVWEKMARIYGAFLIYIVGAVVVYYFAHLVIKVIDHFLHAKSPMEHPYVLIIGVIIFAVYIVMLYLAFPLSIIDKKPLSTTFFNGVVLGEKNKFGVLVSLAIFAGVVLLLTPDMIHEYLLSTYHLDALFDFIVLCVAGPIYFNFLLFVINDSKVQGGR